MDIAAAVVSGAFGLVLGVPAAGVGFSVPAHGRGRLSPRALQGGGVHPAWVVSVVSAVTGAAAWLMGARLGWSSVLPGYVFALAAGAALGITDVRVRRLPYVLSGSVYAVTAGFFAVHAIGSGDLHQLVRAGLSAAVVLTTFLVLALALPGQLGLGDVVMVGWIAMTLAWLGWERLVIGLLAGLALQSLVAVAVRLLHRQVAQMLPMGPALLAGWLIGVFTVGA